MSIIFTNYLLEKKKRQLYLIQHGPLLHHLWVLHLKLK
jgi:hypothetical protein